MTVYVDQITTVIPKDPQTKRLGSRWCHLFADTEKELHNFAGLIGMKINWFQNSDVAPHYDLTPSRRQKAVMLGATTITTKNYLRLRRNRE